MVDVVQGFGPFGEFTVNPSEVLVSALGSPSGTSSPEKVVAEVVDVSYQRVGARVRALIEEHHPSLWLGVGLAAGRTALSLEAVAVNLADWSDEHADVDGLVVERQPVVAGGPAAYLTTLPVEEILSGWKEAGIPGYLSQTAGSYMCNQSFYTAAQVVAELGITCQVGFLHLPLLPEVVTRPDRQPSMAGEMQRAGIEAVLGACRTATDAAGLYLRRTA